jgi:hypothetical protein
MGFADAARHVFADSRCRKKDYAESPCTTDLYGEVIRFAAPQI